MFSVSYINNSNDAIELKGGFNSTKDASEWVKNQGNKITPLKLLVWDEEIQCCSTLRNL